MLGIGVVTFNRLPCLKVTLEAIKDRTHATFVLAVGDDGSEDGTTDWCRQNGVVAISGRNRGIDWNRNRLLFYLWRVCGCNPICLIEDDARPDRRGWERFWIETVARWQFVTWTYEVPANMFGEGTLDIPYFSKGYGMQCAFVTANALEQVGYFDTRFSGVHLGCGDVDWVCRLSNAHANLWQKIAPARTPPVIKEGIVTGFEPSRHVRQEEVQSHIIRHALRGEGGFRPPFWTTEDALDFAKELQVVCDISPGSDVYPRPWS